MNETNNCEIYGIRLCNNCKKTFIIKSAKQRYAIEKEEAYHREVICIDCWKEIFINK